MLFAFARKKFINKSVALRPDFSARAAVVCGRWILVKKSVPQKLIWKISMVVWKLNLPTDMVVWKLNPLTGMSFTSGRIYCVRILISLSCYFMKLNTGIALQFRFVCIPRCTWTRGLSCPVSPLDWGIFRYYPGVQSAQAGTKQANVTETIKTQTNIYIHL